MRYQVKSNGMEIFRGDDHAKATFAYETARLALQSVEFEEWREVVEDGDEKTDIRTTRHITMTRSDKNDRGEKTEFTAYVAFHTFR